MVIVDIETYRTDNENYLKYKTGNVKAPSGYKDEEKIKNYIEKARIKAYQKAALSPLTGRVVLIGIMADVDSIKNLDDFPDYSKKDTELGTVMHTTYGLDGKTEHETLESFWNDLVSFIDNGNTLVTYRGKIFDIPFLIRRSIINNVQKPNFLSMSMITDRWSNEHIDLFNVLNPIYKEYSSLNEWSYLLGDSSDVSDNEASKIGDWYEKGEFDIIKEKCIEDLFKTFFLYKRVQQWM